MDEQDKRLILYGVRLTTKQARQIQERADATRHKPTEIIYFIISDYLNGVIK